MESIKEELSDREKQEAAIRLLRKLGQQLQSSDASTRRRAAYNLSWMQEDGLAILNGVLCGNFHVTAKNAAAYGLRNMRGRMKKMAIEILKEGLKHKSSDTREVCRNAFLRLDGKTEKKPAYKGKEKKTRYEIRDIPSGNRTQRTVGMMRDNRRGPVSNRRPPRH